MAEWIKLGLNLLVLIIPLIFGKKDDFYNERIKTVNKLLSQKRKDFEGMSNAEKTIAMHELVSDLNRIFELRP